MGVMQSGGRQEEGVGGGGGVDGMYSAGRVFPLPTTWLFITSWKAISADLSAPFPSSLTPASSEALISAKVVLY